MLREQGDTEIDLGSTKNYFGEHQENNSGSREKAGSWLGQIVSQCITSKGMVMVSM